MAVRIRYTKTKKPYILKSVRNFVGQQGALYQVLLNTDEMTYKIKNVRGNAIIRSSEKDGVNPPKNDYTLKEQAKRALQTVGVTFDIAIRGLTLDN